jgi:hypothetical protein
MISKLRKRMGRAILKESLAHNVYGHVTQGSLSGFRTYLLFLSIFDVRDNVTDRMLISVQ